MLYLEDYMEMIENLPMEMRDRFTEMREMDLQVQNAMDSLDDRLKNFFKKCGTTPVLKQEWKDEQFNKLKEDYQAALEDADEKVQLATTIYDLLERYLRKLDQELSKFKMELEADSMGITEILEKRSLELDRPLPSSNHRAEKRKYSSMMGNSVEKRNTATPTTTTPAAAAAAAATAAVASASVDKDITTASNVTSRESVSGSRSNSAAPSPGVAMFNSATPAPATPALSYSLGHVGAGSNAAIAAAASRAIGATLEMQQGRRTASLKASYEAMRSQHAGLTKEFSSSFTQQNFTTADNLPPPPSKASRQKKSRTHQHSRQQQQQQQQQQAQSLPSSSSQLPSQTSDATLSSTLVVDDGASVDSSTVQEENTSTNWQYDPNEPRYCLCNDVSYGDMVGCDNNDCPIEWFHYACVGLAQAPKGKWFCPQCMAAMKRRGRK